MYPFLHVGSFVVSSFSATMLLGFLVATGVGVRQARFVGVPTVIVWQLLPWAAAGGVIGAKLYSLLFQLPRFLRGDLALWQLGEVWYGGLALGIVATAWRFARSGYPMHWLFDYAGAPVAFGHMIGRVGCFLVGDDYGIPTSGPLGVVFPHGTPPTTAASLRAQGVFVAPGTPADSILAVYPVQLFEAIALLCIGLWLWRQSRRAHRPLGVFAQYLLLYGGWRFAIEFIRVKDDHLWFGLTSAQLVSLTMVTGALVLMRRRGPIEAAPPEHAALTAVAHAS